MTVHDSPEAKLIMQTEDYGCKTPQWIPKLPLLPGDIQIHPGAFSPDQPLLSLHSLYYDLYCGTKILL